MITTEHGEGQVSVTVFGEFELHDYKEFEELVRYKLKFEGRQNLFMDLRKMTGFTIDVAWEEIRFSREHKSDFGRIAIITSDQWVTWSAWVSQMFVEADVQVFDDEDDARAWLASAPQTA
ncbi:STAS/SEC14 domain-containing protein [Nitrogeniibacter mangrovi]|uniref:STAS/SEC14 domain-containing protein n=1 Tax=Nitrogeniibacter mangrovi TaxID=2016596 RepID=A0A6C1B8U0_9RHOO|nr:STAS/SEC14 domain-containing protein [Nitrogeniibacter mangrovi]QID18664.1 STAS/SEC14 domain-containing protein [Nitrogeniibacter mangrovi]